MSERESEREREGDCVEWSGLIVRVLRECAPGERAAAVAEGAKQTRFTHTHTYSDGCEESTVRREHDCTQTETDTDTGTDWQPVVGAQCCCCCCCLLLLLLALL